MNKREFVQAHVMTAYERMLKAEPLTVDTKLTMRFAVEQTERAWVQLSDFGYGGKTKITVSGDIDGVIDSQVNPRSQSYVDPMDQLDDGKHKNKSVEYWAAKLKEAQGNPNFDHRDTTEIRNAMTSAEVSKMVGFGYYK